MVALSGTWSWSEHLTSQDWGLLGRSAQAAGIDVERLHDDEAALAAVLSHPVTFEAVWGDGGDEALVVASPFLVFATAVHRAWVDLRHARHVEEWVGARQRLPILGTDDLRAFLAATSRRLFLASLLASYTKVASGSTWVHTGRGWRRRRFSELDPVRLASLLEALPPTERPGIYRRLGDLALFLTGVFPDHTTLHGLGSVAEGRLLRAAGLAAVDRPDEGITSPVALLEALGERWYRLACRTAGSPRTGTLTVVADVAEHFGLARRALNVITDRHLFPLRSRWFGMPEC